MLSGTIISGWQENPLKAPHRLRQTAIALWQVPLLSRPNLTK